MSSCQFMRFEFNQRTRLSTGSRNFGILDARIFRRQIFFIDEQPVRARYASRGSPGPAMRVRSRCRLQLLELGAGSCAIWPRRGPARRSASCPRVRKCTFEEGRLERAGPTAALRSRAYNTVECCSFVLKFKNLPRNLRSFSADTTHREQKFGWMYVQVNRILVGQTRFLVN